MTPLPIHSSSTAVLTPLITPRLIYVLLLTLQLATVAPTILALTTLCAPPSAPSAPPARTAPKLPGTAAAGQVCIKFKSVEVKDQ